MKLIPCLIGLLIFAMLIATLPAATQPQYGEWLYYFQGTTGNPQSSGTPQYPYAAPAIVSHDAERLDHFSLDTTNWGSTGSQLKQRTFIEGSGWQSPDFISRVAPLMSGTNPVGVATDDAGTRIDLWAMGSSGYLYQTSWADPLWAAAWQLPAGQHFTPRTGTGPAVLWQGSNEYVFWVNNTNERLIMWKWTGTGPLDGWENPVDFGQPFFETLVSSPSACNDGNNIWIFVKGSDNKLHACYKSQTTVNWISLSDGSDLRGAPSAVSRYPGVIDVFYVTSGNKLVSRYITANGATISGELIIHGSMEHFSDPAATVWDKDVMFVYLQMVDDGEILRVSWKYQGRDIGVFRPSTRQFIFNTDPITRITYGLSTDIPVTGDWNNDGRTEIGVFRAVGTQGQFILDLNNDGLAESRVNFGISTDRPVTGDWDDDGYVEIGVYRSVGSQGQFILDNTNCNTPGTRTGTVSSRINFGVSTDIPLPIDWDDDGTTEVGVFRPSARQFIVNTDPITRVSYGLGTDKPVRAIYENYGYQALDKPGVFRNGQFIIRSPETIRYNFGVSTDIPITGIWE